MTEKKPSPETQEKQKGKKEDKTEKPEEFGGFDGLEPTRYGDWEQNGRCSDF